MSFFGAYRELVRDVARLMRVRAEAKGVPFHVEFATPLPVRIEGDPTRVRQVLINLADNAVKFTEQGEVVLALTRVAPDLRRRATICGVGR